ncbi:uncharacterized protein [Haliotis cracherodii]|uniref:uncharacterized protein n=1 Tax=Haliotis cracherodii TaxID=6455 RepID=UPI0039ED1696
MDCIRQSRSDLDVPTPTKDEPVTSKTYKSHTNGGQNTNDADENQGLPAGTIAGSESRDCATPTVDENYSVLDCPTPTLDEPVEQYTTSSNVSDLTISDVKCKLFVKDDGEGQSEILLSKVEGRDVKDSGSSQGPVTLGESNSQCQDVSDGKLADENSEDKEPMKDGSGSQGLERKALVVETDSKIPNLTKTLSNESHDSNEPHKQIVVTYNEDQFTCNECDFTGKGHHFEEHLMCHLIQKPYQCLYCKEAFASRKEVGKHLSTMHKGKKLNCMLKALSRAKNLMLEAKKTNSCVFFALVSGRELSLKRKLSVDSVGSVGTLSRTSSGSDSSEPSKLTKLPSKPTLCASENNSLSPKRRESSTSKDRTMSVEDLGDITGGIKEAQEDVGSIICPEGEKRASSEELDEKSPDDSKHESDNDKIEHGTLEEISENREELKVSKDLGIGTNVSENEAKDEFMAPMVTKDKGHASDHELPEVSDTDVTSNDTSDSQGKETVCLGSRDDENKEVPEDDSSGHTLTDIVNHVPHTHASDDSMRSESLTSDDLGRITKSEEVQGRSDKDVPECGNKDNERHEFGIFVKGGIGQVVSASPKDNDEKEVSDEGVVNVCNEVSSAAEDDDQKEVSDQVEKNDIKEMLDVENSDKNEILADGEEHVQKEMSADSVDSDKKEVSRDGEIHSIEKKASGNGESNDKNVTGDGEDGLVEKEVSGDGEICSMEKEVSGDREDNHQKEVSGDREDNHQKEVSGDGENHSIEKEVSGDREDNHQKEVSDGENHSIEKEVSGDCPLLGAVRDNEGHDIGGESQEVEEEVPGDAFTETTSKDNDMQKGSDSDQEDKQKSVDNETLEGKTNLDKEECSLNAADLEEDDERQKQQEVSCHEDVTSETTITDEVCHKDDEGVQKPEPRDSNINSEEKVDETSSTDFGDMGLKIVASFSLDGDEFSKPEEDKDGDDSEIVTSKTHAPSPETTDKSVDDTSGLVIDVFKDGRISVHNTKENISEDVDKNVCKPSEQTADVDVESVPQSKPQQSKLGQLLTGTAAFPTSVIVSSPPTASTQPASKTIPPKPPSVPGITPAQMKHMRNPNFYVCGLNCNFSCLNSVEFRDHLFMGHAGEKAFPCYYCGWLAHTEESLLRHITNHAHNYSKIAPLYLCGMQRCKFGTNLLSDLLNHMQILHHDITLYICKECNETFSHVKELVSHFDENFIHVVNCPHCACKGTDRRMILKHISEYHPGKAKMVSVAKQIICKDRKINNYKRVKAQYKCDSALLPEKPTAIPGSSLAAVPEKKQLSPTPSSATYTTLKHNETTTQSDATKVKVENTVTDSEYGNISSNAPAAATKTPSDGSPPEKQINAPKCSHCTFVARDQKRLESHMKCHGLPVIKRHRFRCLYCPQGFDSSQKFRLHINCHPGLIKYWMYCCKRCDFDTNQRYVMLRHIRMRDELHFNEGNEEDMFSVVERIVESRVLECEHCNYQTRHKLHLQIHYQREHKVVKAAAQSSTDADKQSVAQQVAWVSPPKHSSSSSDSCQENMSKKFKCPFCRYLVPKAADLKSHVKKHANLGKITLDFLRCRYCSLSSTAREIVYTHIRDKHQGKPLVLVRKIVTIDCSGTDNSFSETSVTEAPVAVTSSSSHGIDKFQCETCSFATNNRGQFEVHVQLHNTTKGGILGMSMVEDSDDDDVDEEDVETGVDHPQPEDEDTSVKPAPDVKPSPVDVIEQVYVIPEAVAGDQLSSPARCCNCYYASGYRSAFIDHMKTNHSSVMLVIRNKGTAVEQICPSGKMFFGLPTTLNNEVLLVPDRQVFTQAVKCPKCPYFTTYFRRNLVLHLTKDHPEITAMGKCTWPGWQTGSGDAVHAAGVKPEPHVAVKKHKRQFSAPEKDESCIIGSGDLDEQIACLYKNFGDRQQCLICNSVKPKKFFMHIHLLRHLNIFLVKCPYCSHKGLQKYKIGRHIRTNHPEQENVVKEVHNDIPKKVADFLAHQKKVVAAATSSPSPSGDNVTFMDNQHVSLHSGSPGKDIHSTNKMSGPLGTSYLDEKLLCLYTCTGGKNKCNLCSVEFARKYAIHRHIVVNHLKVSLLKCGHCNFEGVEKHVIIDHILEQHKNQLIKFEPLNINMEGKVKEFLNTYNVVKSEPESVDVKPLFSPSPAKSFGPQAYCLGKDKLHNKLMPLFCKKNDSYKCNLCKWKFPRKYAIHRHILMKHLKIGLYGCTHCHVQGAEKYIVVSHMKEAHPRVSPQARILEVDMDHRIQEVLHEVASGTGSHTSGRMPPTYYEEDIPDPAITPNKSMTEYQDEVDQKPTEADKKQMVVAMFGKKRKSLEPAESSQLDSAITPKKLKTTSRMVDVTTEIKVVCIEEGSFKKYVCEKCRFTSLHRSNVYRHVLRIHERYRELQCEYCGYKSYSKVLLNQHIEVEHGGQALLKDTKDTTTIVKEEPEEPMPDPPPSSSPGETVKHYACAYCNFETNTAENIIKHTRENHAPGSGEASRSAGGEKSTASSDPDITVSTHEHVIKKSSVKRGTFTESQMLYCGYCTFKAPGIQALKDHHKAMHQSSKLCIISPQPWRYICRICGLKNNAGSKMRCHLNRHLEYRPYTCSSCSQPYASTDELRKHVRSLQHSDNFQYRKHEKKEQKINRFLEESRKNALLVNLGVPPDSETAAVPRKPVSAAKLKEGKPSVEFKFKGIKRSMKMPMSPTKSLKKKYMKTGLDRDSKAVTKDIACYWCDIPHTVCVDQMKQHHAKAHQDKDFLWVDTRQGNTCTMDGEIVETGNLSEIPKIHDLYASKKLSTGKNKFYCTKCSFSAWYLPAMVSHCRCHLPKKYLCAYCHLRYSNREYLEKHQRTFHPGREIWMLHMVETADGQRPQATSSQASTVSSMSVKQEMLDEAVPAASIDERRISQSVMYCCNFCSYRNESLYQYRLHLPLHGTFKHLKTDLLNDSPLKCGFCPFVATDQSDFSFHITTHFENRSFKCAHCNYSAYTRAHVKFHSANQHPDMEQTVLDLSSCSSYVEYLKAEKTNLPKLVDLDPRVVVKDITTMTQHDLEEMMTREHNSDCHAYDEDEDVDVVGIEVAVNKTASERDVDVKVVNVAAEAGPKDDPVDECSQVTPMEDEKAITSVYNDCDPQAVVSSSIGEPEETPDFDLAEVSAFVEDAVVSNIEAGEDKDNEDNIVVEADSKPSSGKGSDLEDSKYLDSSFDDKVNGSASADEIDGELKESVPKEVVPKVKDPEERQRKDDSGNVFDTLHSWLSMK